MLRNALIVLVLAALAVTSATGSPDVSAKAHRRAAAAALSHPNGHSKAARGSHSSGSHQPGRISSPGQASNKRRSLSSSRRRSSGRRVPQDTRGSAFPAATKVSLRTRTLPGSPLKGSLESLEHQNSVVEAEGLERILDEDDLNDRIAQKLLVPVPTFAGLTVDERLPESHRYCRPWTADFLTDLAHAHTARFTRPLFVSSAVRTVEYQKQLMQINGNAAAAEGDIVSPHLTGGTIDIAKDGMSRQELAWMRTRLLPFQLAGTIDVEEEFRQPCFHITVYNTYAPLPPPSVRKGKRHRSAPAAQIASRGR